MSKVQTEALNNFQLKTENYLFNCQLLTANCQLRHQCRKLHTEIPVKSLNISIIPMLLLTLSTLMPISSIAERIEYNVEILIFEDTAAQYIHSEKWPNNKINADEDINEENLTDTSVALPTIITNIDTKFDIYSNNELELEQEAEYPENNNVINIIDIEQGILSEQAEVINRSSRYNILVHKTWRQTGLDKHSVIDIPIDSKNFTFKSSTKNHSLIDIEPVNFKTTEFIPSYIDGVITIELARYLHFYTDLTYHKQVDQLSPLNTQSKQLKAFPLKTHRRMRSKVLHYIDHPLVGILLKVAPVNVIKNDEKTNQPETAQFIDG